MSGSISAMAGPKRFFWLILAPGSAQDPTCWDGVFTKDLCCDKRYGPKGNEGCWDPVHTFERCCGVEEDCRVSEEFNPEKCCDLVKSDRGDEACWSGAQTFEHCCGGNRTPRVTGEPPLEKLPTFGEGCWDAERLVTFGRCCGGTAFEDVCWTGDFSYDRCCIGLGPIQRYFMDLPKEHDMVRCVREGLEGPSKAKANITYEECSGKYLYVSAVSYRYAEVVAMHDFWWQRPQDEKMDRIGPEVTAPEWLSHAGEVCVPKICSCRHRGLTDPFLIVQLAIRVKSQRTRRIFNYAGEGRGEYSKQVNKLVSCHILFSRDPTSICSLRFVCWRLCTQRCSIVSLGYEETFDIFSKVLDQSLVLR